MKNGKLSEIEKRIYKLIPERITIYVLKDGNTIEVSICELHKMLHNKEIEFDDIQSEWNNVFAHTGNSFADMRAWLHILMHHTTGIHKELSKEIGVLGVSEDQQHEELLQDMTGK